MNPSAWYCLSAWRERGYATSGVASQSHDLANRLDIYAVFVLYYIRRASITQVHLHLLVKELAPMFSYRLFHPVAKFDDQSRARRPVAGHPARRIYQLPIARRAPVLGSRR